MRIVGDVLLFFSTSQILSVTLLCAVIQIQARDEHSRSFLYILVPLTLQLGLATLSSYLGRVLPPATLNTEFYRSFSLLAAIASIVLISVILYSVSLYIMRVAREYVSARLHVIGSRLLLPLVALFVVLSLFAVFYVTRGNWAEAISLTLKYYSSWGILFLLPHVIAAAVLLPRVTVREAQNHLRGIIFAFAPIAVLFPLDVIYFRDHFFKLGYVSFAAFSLVVYWHISRRFVREYDIVPERASEEDVSFARFNLSPREEEIARVLIEGKTNAEIAREFFISENTVRSHIKAIYRKAGVSNRVQLIHAARARYGPRPSGASS